MYSKGYSLLLIAAAFLALPLTANAQSLDRPPGDAGDTGTVEPGQNETTVSRGNGEIVLTQSNETTFVKSGLVRCAVNPNNPDNPDERWSTPNGWFRVFDLSEVEGLEEGLMVTSADVGIGGVNYHNDWPVQTASLRFYTLEGELSINNLTPIDSVQIEMTEDLELTIPNIEVSGVTVPADAQLVVEFFVPDVCFETNDAGEIVAGGCDITGGDNSDGATAPTYIYSYGYCASVFEDITDVADINFPDETWVLAVRGVEATVANEEGVVPAGLRMDLYPNPVANTARLDLQLDTQEQVTVTVFDVTGREITTLHEGAVGGQLVLEFDSSEFTSGVYIVQLRGETFSTTRKFFVLR